MATDTDDGGGVTVGDGQRTERGQQSADPAQAEQRRHGLSHKNLDDAVATVIVIAYLAIAVAMLGGWGEWSRLPSTFQYWVTSAFVIALGLLFGKGVNEYRRGLT